MLEASPNVRFWGVMQTSQARRAHRVITTDDSDGISTTPASSTWSGEPVALSSKPHRASTLLDQAWVAQTLPS